MPYTRYRNPEARAEYMRNWELTRGPRVKNKDAVRAYKERHPEQVLNSRLKGRYGMTLEQYNERLADQNGLCAICYQPPAEGKRLYVDHDHESGAVRGLLCFACNRGLGAFNDHPGLMVNAAVYLQGHCE